MRRDSILTVRLSRVRKSPVGWKMLYKQLHLKLTMNRLDAFAQSAREMFLPVSRVQ